MQRGTIVLEGPTEQVRSRLDDLEAAYLSVQPADPAQR
jgi:hypothetical protein